MNPAVLRRFIVLLFVATLLVGGGTLFYDSMFDRLPGDYEVEKGSIHLEDGELDQAMDYFNQALVLSPDHRGALMGRALVYIKGGQTAEAQAELTYLIDYLTSNLAADDPTGRGTLAAAYGNRGILHDRAGRYEAALADYIKALEVDSEAVSGPGIAHKILRDAQPSTVRDRARYLHEQLQLPEAQRLMRVPELDAKQRMYKP